MFCTRQWCAVAGVSVIFMLGLSAVPAFARFITMPPTARTWIDIRGTAGVELDPVTGTPISDTVGQFFASETAIPLAEYDSILPLMSGNRTPNLHLFAEGSVNGNTLRSFVSGEGTTQQTPAIQMFSSSNDTFTLHGTPEQIGQSVPLTAHFDVNGTASVFGRQTNTSLTIGQVFVTAKMGSFNPVLVDFHREDLRISPFDAATNAVFNLRRTNQASVSGIIDLHIARTFNAIVGTPFDIGYGLNIQAFDSVAAFPTGTDGFTADLLHTAMIDFDVPTGYSLTSVLGFTSAPALTLPGDANGDNRVNRADLALVTRSYGLSDGALWSDGDFDGTGRVDLLDVAILQSHYGQSVIAPSAAAVPEPATGILLLCCTAAAIVASARVTRRRAKRQRA